MNTKGYTPPRSMAHKNKTLGKWALRVLAAALALLALVMVLGDYLDQAVVHYDGGVPIACKAEGTDWKLSAMSHPACAAALKGGHHAVFVSGE